MAYQHNAMHKDIAQWSKPLNLPLVTDAMVIVSIHQGHLSRKLTRSFLQKQQDWIDWKLSEYAQLNTYKEQDMFGAPVKRPLNYNVLPLI